MQNRYSDDQLHLAARLYYVEGMGQTEVAKFVRISQAKVSRLLALARERGIVRVTVADYESRDKELETRLRVQLGQAIAIVIKTPDHLPVADLRKTIGLFAAAALEDLIRPKDIIAIGSGRTVRELIANIPESYAKSPTIVQSVGSVDSNVSAFDAQEIGRVFSQRLGGSFVAMNTPAYVSDKEMRDALLTLDQVRVVNTHLNRASIAVVGVGTLDNSVFIERSILTNDDIKALRAAGAVGEIGGRFYDAFGKECESPWRDRVLSLEFRQLAKIPKVIGVVAGTDRAASILAAIRGGFLKGLITDEPSARALLNLNAKASGGAPKPKGRKIKK
jgi:DNA-binding transcriptional regulator LsrR (DeoR family)